MIYFHSVHTSVFTSAPNPFLLADAAFLRSAAVASEAVRCRVTESYKSRLRSGVYSGFSRFKDIERSGMDGEEKKREKGASVMNFSGET